MGYSSTVAAGKTSDLWTRACLAQTGSSNVFISTNGFTYFWERGQENDDGAETGAVWQFEPSASLEGKIEGKLARKSGSYRIEPDGTVTRAPAFLKAASATRDTHLRTTPGARERALSLGA